MLETDKLFAGSIPENYDRYMVPLIFEPYAADIAQRAASLSPSAVLETAAGSGVVTRALAPRRCSGTAVRRCGLRSRLLPVRRDVLSRSYIGLSRSKASPKARRIFFV